MVHARAGRLPLRVVVADATNAIDPAQPQRRHAPEGFREPPAHPRVVNVVIPLVQPVFPVVTLGAQVGPEKVFLLDDQGPVDPGELVQDLQIGQPCNTSDHGFGAADEIDKRFFQVSEVGIHARTRRGGSSGALVPLEVGQLVNIWP